MNAQGLADERLVELFRRRKAAEDANGPSKAERVAYWDGRIDEYAIHHETSAREIDTARAEVYAGTVATCSS